MALTEQEEDRIVLKLVDRLSPFMEEMRSGMRDMQARIDNLEKKVDAIPPIINRMDKELREEIKASEERVEAKLGERIDNLEKSFKHEINTIARTVYSLKADYYKVVDRVLYAEEKLGIKRPFEEM
jgi:regulator of PEP synthase PpsR (kinase-PPPase family)